jgi:threonine synthase
MTTDADRPPEQAPVEPVPTMLDAATPNVVATLPGLEEERRIAADPNANVAARVEAYETIVDSEIGDTNLGRARNLERETGLRQLYLKFDGGNPTGTQKDRIAFAQVMDAMRRGFDTVTAATCGNYGAALALAASVAGMRCVLFVPRSYKSRRVDEMRAAGAHIELHDGDYESSVDGSRAWAARHEQYDANPGGDNAPIQLRAYGEIAYEIYDDLRDAPAAVAVPVSNGTTLAGIHRGFLSLFRRGKTSRMPRIVAGSSYRKNPIVQSYLSGLEHCVDLDPRRIHETDVNEPLINWHSIDGDDALWAVRSTGGWAAPASDRAMRAMARSLRESEGLSSLPASTAGLLALLGAHRREPLPNDRYVAVLTGRR